MSNIMAISYEDQIPVTQSDTVADPAGPFAGFYVGSIAGGATIKYTNIRGRVVTLPGVQAGVAYTFPCTMIWTSVTTASSIFGLVALPYKQAMNPGAGIVQP